MSNNISVPYWGSLYFKKSAFVSFDYNPDLFPSPIGVLYISICPLQPL